MKKFITILFTLIICCSMTIPVTHAKGIQQKKLTYTNLVDKQTQKKINGAMNSSNIPYKSQRYFLKHVNEFNRAVKYVSLIPHGYKTINGYTPKYNEDAMANRWYKAYPEKLGVNCRLTTFGLIKDFINVKNTRHPDLDTLAFDQHVLKSSKEYNFTAYEKAMFYKLFSAIPVKKFDRKSQIRTIQNFYKQNAIKFSNKKVKMISVYLPSDVDDTYKVFAGHVGILLKQSDGKYLFIEKLAFQKPYQAIQLNNTQDLKKYLTALYKSYGNKKLPQPIIMENDQELR
ncbi:DUF4300 family protein [Macrococcoides bohemicum]|uniref:DUF4300 family protein n=1 Tax=Macrococcoides bohemicum TaxID=1903056 RepID=UPI0028982A1F|nr:DUF4300 family protein [Macrococcus bohemicus]